METEEMRAVLATMLMDCNVLTTTLSKSFANAMENPLFLLQQENISPASADEVKEESAKSNKKKSKKGKRDNASRSQSKKHSSATDHGTADEIKDEAPTKRRSKVKRREKAPKKASKKRLRDINSDDEQSDNDRNRQKEAKRALRKERKDERRQKKILRRLEAQRDWEDPDYAPAQDYVELSTGSDGNCQRRSFQIRTNRARSSYSGKTRWSVPAMVSDDEEVHGAHENAEDAIPNPSDEDDDEPQSAADAAKRSKELKKSKKKRRKKSGKRATNDEQVTAAEAESTEPEIESELEEQHISARNMLKKLKDSGEKKRAKKAKAARAARKGKNATRYISQELGEGMEEDMSDGDSDGEHNPKGQSPRRLEDSRDSLGSKRAWASKQKAKPSWVDRLSNADVSEEDEPATPNQSFPIQNPKSGTQRKRGRGDDEDDEDSQESDSSPSTKNSAKKRKKQGDNNDSNERHGQEVVAREPSVRARLLSSSPSAVDHTQSPSSSVAQVRPFPRAYSTITPHRQQGHEAGPSRTKEEPDGDSDIQIFNKPITPFKKGKAAMKPRGPLPIRARDQLTPENSSPLVGGVKIGQHTYFMTDNGGNPSILATPSGSRTLSLGNVGPQARHRQPRLASQTRAGPFRSSDSHGSNTHRSDSHSPASHSPDSHNSDTHGSARQGAEGRAAHAQSVRSKPEIKNRVKAESAFQSSPGQLQKSSKSNGGSSKNASLTPSKSEKISIKKWKEAMAASPNTPKSQQNINLGTPSLDQISQWTPEGERRFKCNFCGRWFKYSQNPDASCQGMHPGEHFPHRAHSRLSPVVDFAYIGFKIRVPHEEVMAAKDVIDVQKTYRWDCCGLRVGPTHGRFKDGCRGSMPGMERTHAWNGKDFYPRPSP